MTRTIRRLGEEDLGELIRIRAASFPSPGATHHEEERARLEPRLPWTWGVEAEGGLAAVATWLPYRAWIGGVRVETGALASVAAAPEHRRRGHVRALLLDGLRRLHERGVGFALEHPFDPRFYAALGFRSVPAGTQLDLPLERIAGDPKGVNFAPVSEERTADLVDVHATFARRWSFALDRDWRPGDEPVGEGPQWRRVFSAWRDGPPPVAYATPGGYAILAVRTVDDADVLEVGDVAWADTEGRSSILAMLGAWRGQAERLRIDLPAHDPAARDEAAHHGRPRSALQARIVDLPSALRPLRDSAAAPRTVRIFDPHCPWNDGTWRIAPGADGTEVSRAGGAADAELHVAGLVSLLAGTPPAVVLAQGEAGGDASALADLARLTAAHPPFLGRADHF